MDVLLGALLGTLSILCFNAVLAATATGLGLSLRRAFRLTQPTLEDCSTAFWMGFGLIILFAMLWNFWFPLGGGLPLTIIILAGMTGILATRPWTSKNLLQPPLPLWSVVVALLFSLWVANLSLGRMTAWDSALYHMQGERWASDYRLLPGLANVFGPVGFNNASLLYDAILDAGPWAHRAWHVSNGVLVSVFGAQLITSAARLLQKGNTSSTPVLSLLLLTAAVASAHDGVPNFMTVTPASLVLMVVGVLAYRTVTETKASINERAYAMFCIPFLAAIAVAIKVSSAVSATLAMALCIYGIFRLGEEILRARTLRWTFAAVTAVGLTWAIRGVILSGYPLFPSSFLPLPVDWRVPIDHARAEYAFALHSALATAENYAFVAGRVGGPLIWFKRWIWIASENLYELYAPLLLIAAVSCFFILSWRRATPAERATIRPAVLVLLALMIAIAGWFAVSPMPAYGSPLFWSFGAVLGTMAYRLSPRSGAFNRKLFAAGCALAITPLLLNPLRVTASILRPRAVLAEIVDANIKLPDPGQWYQITKPPELTVYKTATGVILNVPTGLFGRCWDAAAPCTPNPAPNLRFRIPNSVEGGFAVDGPWQMRDWPEPWRPKLLPALRENWRRHDSSAVSTGGFAQREGN